MAELLIDKGVIASLPDPRDPRRHVYRLSDRAKALRSAALTTITELERRIGAARVAALRDALAADWGPEVITAAELAQGRRQKRQPASR